MAWIRKPEEMPGTFPVDPREIAAIGIHERFVDQLREGKVIETHPVTDSDGRRVIEVLLESSKGRCKGMRCRYRFDPAMNYLPTKVESLADDGSVTVVINIIYQEMIPQSAWFLRRADWAFVSTQTMTSRTKGNVHIHQKINDGVFTMDSAVETSTKTPKEDVAAQSEEMSKTNPEKILQTLRANDDQFDNLELKYLNIETREIDASRSQHLHDRGK